MKRLLIIDAHAIIHRAYHALPPLTTQNGEPINAVYGFLLITLSALREIKPDYVAVCFDSKEATFRHEAYEEYKATRAKTDDDLISQFPFVLDVVKALGFADFAMPRYEADDLIGTISKKIQASRYVKEAGDDIRSIILSGDMDLLQLVDESTQVMRLRKGVKDTELFDPAHVREVWGFEPEQMIEYKGLRGDASDNIKGVKGIGEKTAKDLIAQFGTIENIYKNIDSVTGRAKKLLEGNEKDALFSRKLATIEIDAPIEFSLAQMKIGQYNEPEIMRLFREFQFKSLLSQLPHLPGFQKQEGLFAQAPSQNIEEPQVQNNQPKTSNSKGGKKHHSEEKALGDHGEWLTKAQSQSSNAAQPIYTLLNTEAEIKKIIDSIPQHTVVAIDTETTGLKPMQDDLVGVSFSFEENTGFYVPCYTKGTVAIPKALKAFLEDESIKKTGHNIKFDIESLHRAGIQTQGIVFDTMLASYVLNTGGRAHSLDDLVFTEFGYSMQPITDLIGKGKAQITMADVDVEKVSWYACEDADFSLRLYHLLEPRLKEKKLDELFYNIELPTMHALVPIEEAGVKIDVAFLKKMSTKLHKRIHVLDADIQDLAGAQFNVASPVQLKNILFETLGLPTEKIKKTKTGYSTAASELEKLRGTHPIIEKIEEFRELSKLTSTYIDTLPLLINPFTNRIHTNYNQTIAATGRLSSQDPNLQNIPIRTELGNEIRKAFIAEPGRKIVSLDYSQIELRVAAHIANDAFMIEAFQNNADIHRSTAAELNDIAVEDVTPQMRREAKAINFGVLYGMGVQGIMRDSGASREAAKAFLEKYFTVHTGIHAYMEKTKEETRKLGYAETLFGRRRYLPEIHARNQMLRAAAERAAINTPIQGTAADIMKLAMIAVQQAIDADKIDATMIMQVHDELVFEIDEKKVGTESKKIAEIMEHVYELRIPLVVEGEYGDSWGEGKDLA